jgi:predicted Zn-dependent protease
MQERFRSLLQQICEQYPDYKFEFYYRIWETDFLRFFQSQVNYNISKSSNSLHVSIHQGKRKYGFQIYNPNETTLYTAIEEALPLIPNLPEDPFFVDLEDNLEMVEETAKANNIRLFTLEQKIDLLERVSQAVAPFGFEIYGTFICNFETIYMVNSNGINKKMQTSPVMLELKAVSKTNQVTVLEAYGSENPAAFDVDVFIGNLLLKVANAGQEIVDVEPGNYEVILSPRCIGEFIAYLTYGMSARSVDSKDSCFMDKTGVKMFPAHISLTDDPHHPDLINVDYNSDGHIYKKLNLIENGVFQNFMTNNYYSHKTGLPKNGNEGDCLVLNTGDKSLEEMIGSIKNGLYISSLHYMNFINTKETSVTGLTRDGTFLIEDGKLTKVVNNLRFTERLVRILENVTESENKAYTVPASQNYDEFSIYASRMPHVKVSGFQISSSTRTI